MDTRYWLLTLAVGAGLFVLLSQYLNAYAAGAIAIWLSCLPMLLGLALRERDNAARPAHDDDSDVPWKIG